MRCYNDYNNNKDQISVPIQICAHILCRTSSSWSTNSISRFFVFFSSLDSHYNVFFFLLFTWYSIVVIALLYFCTWKIQFISRRQSTVSKSRPLLVIAFYFLWNINFLRFSFSIRCSYNFCIILPLPTPCHSFRR